MNANELKLRQQYWLQVRECLIRFHNLTQKQADDEVLKLLKKMPITSSDPSVDFVYHVEPFRLACKVTGERLSVKDFVGEYQEILDETTFWTASNKSTLKVKDSLLAGLKGLFRMDYLSDEAKQKASAKKVRETRSKAKSYAKPTNERKKSLKPVASSGKTSAVSPKKKTTKKKPLR